MNNFCKNAYTSSNKKDESGHKPFMCLYTKEMCIAQRLCGEKNDYIISERAEKICSNYNK